MRRLKVLFCTPPYHPYNLADHRIYVTEPIQFEVVSSLLDQRKFEIDVLDLRLERQRGAFLEKLNEFRPDVLGFSSWTMHVDSVRDLCRLAKRCIPSLCTVVGGHHTSIQPSDFAIRAIDFVLIAESYPSVVALFDHLYDRSTSLTGVRGIAYQADGEFRSNGAGVVSAEFDLDELPFPDREIVSRYLPRYYHLWWKPIASLRTAMGCPSRCSFCNLWKANIGKYLRWSPEYVVDYLETIEQKYVLFVDDHFFGDANRAARIGEAILRRGIRKSYCLYSRSDAIAKHPELIELWARIGLKRVRMGLESYSDVTLDGLNKCNSVDHNDRAIEILKANGVLTEGLFMVGLDYTSRQFDELADYIRSRRIEVPNITVYTPMPGTPDFEAHRDRLIYRRSPYFDFQHATLETKLDIVTFCKLYGQLIARVQRPPWEQLQIIGLSSFLKRMPSFWAYFWRLRTSHTHYVAENRVQDPRANPFHAADSLPWHERVSEPPVEALVSVRNGRDDVRADRPSARAFPSCSENALPSETLAASTEALGASRTDRPPA